MPFISYFGLTLEDALTSKHTPDYLQWENEKNEWILLEVTVHIMKEVLISDNKEWTLPSRGLW